jgi:hypothetical protein
MTTTTNTMQQQIVNELSDSFRESFKIQKERAELEHYDLQSWTIETKNYIIRIVINETFDDNAGGIIEHKTNGTIGSFSLSTYDYAERKETGFRKGIYDLKLSGMDDVPREVKDALMVAHIDARWGTEYHNGDWDWLNMTYYDYIMMQNQ